MLTAFLIYVGLIQVISTFWLGFCEFRKDPIQLPESKGGWLALIFVVLIVTPFYIPCHILVCTVALLEFKIDDYKKQHR